MHDCFVSSASPCWRTCRWESRQALHLHLPTGWVSSSCTVHLHVPEQAGACIPTCLTMTRAAAVVVAHLLVTGQVFGPRACTCLAVGWTSAALMVQFC